MFSIVLEFPQILNNCLPGSPSSEFSTMAGVLSDSVMDMFKTAVYFDLALNFIF